MNDHPGDNPMRALRVEKIVINIGVGEAGEKLNRAQKALELLTGRKTTQTLSRSTNKDLGIRDGMPIGCKVTLRKQEAVEFLKRALAVRDNRVMAYSFDPDGNFSFGISDYTDFEGLRYNPEIGVFGMDVCVVLSRPGHRVRDRTKAPGHIRGPHRIKKEEAVKWIAETFEVEVLEQ
ncbi:MAG: 50S ribosomal protein L5 [Candidatus Thermoplasmatota archaeon]|jgi:large subunit ribosomal protein L5|nr:50S ribosomal protein L5 [Candidatus Thermoplasmatota archaeon]